jgi:hypothetical protein
MMIDGIDYHHERVVKFGGLFHAGGEHGDGSGRERDKGHGVRGHSCFEAKEVALTGKESTTIRRSGLQTMNEEEKQGPVLYELARDLLKYTFRS